MSGEPRGISECEPPPRIARRHLNRAFCVRVSNRWIVVSQGIVCSPLLPLYRNAFAKGADAGFLRLLRWRRSGDLTRFLSRSLRLLLRLSLLTADFKCLGRYEGDEGENQKESS